MKKMLLFSVFNLFFAVSCKKSDMRIKDFNQLKKVNWFLGTWENLSATARFEEIWSKVNDSTFLGKSIVVVVRDTVFYEKMDLFQKNDSLILKISVKNQNKEKPISFYMTKSDGNEVTFENPKHDFPTKIVYTKITKDSLIAVIYGKKDGKDMNETFPMKKTK
jgi:hypothetical protein